MLEQISDLSIYAVIGIIGVAFYLGSYAALQFGLIAGRGFAYPTCNLIAASCVAVSLIDAYNLSSLLIQAFFICVSLYGIARLYILRHMMGFSVDEAAFLKYALPDIEKEFARPLVKLGTWSDAKPGEVLIQEGRPVEHLVYLADGEAEVSLNNRIVATANKRSLLGEVTCLDGGAANATVTISQPSRLMRIEADKLRKQLKIEPELRSHLERCFKIGIAEKLAATTREVMLSKSEKKPVKSKSRARTKAKLPAATATATATTARRTTTTRKAG